MPDLKISQLTKCPEASLLTGDLTVTVNAAQTDYIDWDTLASCINTNYYKTQDRHFKNITGNVFVYGNLMTSQTGFISKLIGGNIAINTASGINAGVAAGSDNHAFGSFSFVGGGSDCLASGLNSSVLAGSLNKTTANYATITAGAGNLNHSDYSFIGAGVNNTVEVGNGSDPQCSIIGAGTANQIIYGQNSIIGAGKFNYTSGDFSTIAGGNSNSGLSTSASIGGGEKNWIQRTADFSNIAGGSGNIIGTNVKYSCVLGGEANQFYFSSSDHGIIGGGYYNSILTSSFAAILGGKVNQINQSNNSSILGGAGNLILAADNSVICGGGANEIETNSNYSFISCGTGNIIGSSFSSPYSFIIGTSGIINHRGAGVLSDSSSNIKTSQRNDSLSLCFTGGTVISGGRLQLDTNCPVASNATDFGFPGEFFVSGVNLYICTGASQWGRVRLLVY